MCMCEPGLGPTGNGSLGDSFTKDIYENRSLNMDCVLDNMTVSVLSLGWRLLWCVKVVNTYSGI